MKYVMILKTKYLYSIIWLTFEMFGTLYRYYCIYECYMNLDQLGDSLVPNIKAYNNSYHLQYIKKY